jgi:hypothetical protein
MKKSLLFAIVFGASLHSAISAKTAIILHVPGDTINAGRIQDTLNHLGGAGIVQLTKGKYKIYKTIFLKSGQSLIGEGFSRTKANPDSGGSYNDATYIRFGGTGACIFAGDARRSDAQERIKVEGILMYSDNNRKTVGIETRNLSRSTFENLYFDHFDTCFKLGEQSWQCRAQMLEGIDYACGIYAVDGGEDAVFENCFFHSYRTKQETFGVRLQHLSQTILFIGCNFSNNTIHVLCRNAPDNANAMHASFLNCMFEIDTSFHYMHQAAIKIHGEGTKGPADYPSIKLDGCRFWYYPHPNFRNKAVPAILLQKARSTFVENCHFACYAFDISASASKDSVGSITYIDNESNSIVRFDTIASQLINTYGTLRTGKVYTATKTIAHKKGVEMLHYTLPDCSGATYLLTATRVGVSSQTVAAIVVDKGLDSNATVIPIVTNAVLSIGIPVGQHITIRYNGVDSSEIRSSLLRLN